jgi:hypothetical protein
LESGWKYGRQGNGSWKGARNGGFKERAVEKGLGMEEARKGQLESGWKYGRQGKGSWKESGNIGGKERTVEK